MQIDAKQRFEQMVRGDAQAIDLAEAALMIAKMEYPDLEVSRYLQRLEDMAVRIQARLPYDATEVDSIIELNTLLFEEEGFRGNHDDYYDPQNSYLNRVMDRKLGIPITLSILYIEVGRRLGLHLEGVSFPGHFLVKCVLPQGELILDPYGGGVSLTREQLKQQLRQMYGRQAISHAQLLQWTTGANHKEILERLLRNLKAIYLHAGDLEKSLHTIELILMLKPDLPQEVRDRGHVYEQMECFRAALADFNRYLEADPGCPDAVDIRSRIIQLQQAVAKLN